jgi:hypothetical protein
LGDYIEPKKLIGPLKYLAVVDLMLFHR